MKKLHLVLALAALVAAIVVAVVQDRRAKAAPKDQSATDG